MLNDTQLRRINGNPWEGPPELTDKEGLSVRVSPKGKITFQFRYRYQGKPRRLSLGRYPGLTLKQARRDLQAARDLLESGVDPGRVARKSPEPEPQSEVSTVNRLLDEWLAVVGVGLVKHDYWKRQFERHVRPYVGKQVFDDLDFDDWEPLFLRMVANGSAYQAGNVLKRLQQVAAWGRRTRRVKAAVLADIQVADVGAVTAQEGERTLSADEIGLVWGRIDSSRLAPANKIFFKLAVVFMPRTGELRTSQWSHWDIPGRVWEVPKEHMKGRKRSVRRPIPEFVVPWLEQLNALNPGYEHLFPPARVGGADRPMASSVPLPWPSTLAGDIPAWGMHDLRRTGNTRMAELGVAPHVTEKLLGHRMQGVMAIYNRHDYLEEQLAAMTLYHDHLRSWAKKSQES